jgi:hypothetical protein
MRLSTPPLGPGLAIEEGTWFLVQGRGRDQPANHFHFGRDIIDLPVLGSEDHMVLFGAMRAKYGKHGFGVLLRQPLSFTSNGYLQLTFTMATRKL